MYVSVRQYTLKPGAKSELNKKVREGFAPLLKKHAGYVSYHGVDAGGDEWFSVWVFNSKAELEQATNFAKQWVQANIKDLILEGPRFVDGTVVV
jgi:hypothetical protein